VQVVANLVAGRQGAGGPEGLARAIELIQEAVAQADGSATAELVPVLTTDLARFAFLAGRMDTAADAYRKMLRHQPDNIFALNNLAFILADRLEDAASALPFAQRAAELAPGEPSILDTLGYVHYRLGDYQTAEEHLRDSLTAAETAVTTMHLAKVLIATDRLDEATRRLSRAGELRPDPATAAEIERLVDDIRTRTGPNR
jgi:Flp pilus assembly protein TadD